METSKPSLDIVLPCYNPLSGWEDVVIESFKNLQSNLSKVELNLIIVNDGSSQKIENIAIEKINQEFSNFTWLVQQPNQGKGAALRYGMKDSKSDFVVFTDIDFPYTFESTLGVCHAVLEGKGDVVVGQRKKKYYEKTPWQRKLISRLLKKFNKHILRIPVTDTQVGLKGFNREGLKVFLMTTVNRYLFDLEFLILSSRKKRNLRIFPFIVDLRDHVVFSKLNARILMAEVGNISKIILTAWTK